MPSSLIGVIESNADFIREAGARADKERRLPQDLVDWMLGAGLFGIFQPRDYGGLDLLLTEGLDVIEAVSAIDGAAGWCLLKGSTSNQLAAYMPKDGADEVWADPRIVVAGSFNPKGKAEVVDGGYRVSGRWDWGTGITHSAWVLAGAMVIGADGQPAGVKTMVVPRGEVELIDTWDTHGMRGTGSIDFAVSDLFVPAARTLDGPMSRPVLSTATSGVPLAAQMMVPHAAIATGIARGALQAFIDLARGKTPLMAGGKLAEDKLAQDGVGRAKARIDGARAYVHAATTAAFAPGADPASFAALSLASTHATHECVAAVDILYTLAGGSAVGMNSAIARAWRDIHVAASHFLVNNDKYSAAGKAQLAA